MKNVTSSRRVLQVSLLTAAVVGVFSIVVIATLSPGEALARGLFHGLHGGGHGSDHHCERLDGRATELVRSHAGIMLNLDDAQTAAFEPVVEVFDAWREQTRVLCDSARFESTPAALAVAAEMMNNTSAALEAMVPAFDVFYGTLTPEQQQDVDGWLARHHRHQGHRQHDASPQIDADTAGA